jgi:hypothetical protein
MVTGFHSCVTAESRRVWLELQGTKSQKECIIDTAVKASQKTVFFGHKKIVWVAVYEATNGKETEFMPDKLNVEKMILLQQVLTMIIIIIIIVKINFWFYANSSISTRGPSYLSMT